MYGENFLRWTYGSPLGRAALHVLVKRAAFSRWYGRRMDRPASRAKIAPFIAQYGLDPSEFAVPPDRFANFNAFFTRKLRPGSRPVDPNADAAVLPADGRHLVLPDIAACHHFFIKGMRFDLGALLDDESLAGHFRHGAMLISRLCPVDYHRFHFPVAGVPGETRRINGPLFSVNPIALRVRPSILWENQRTLTRLQSTRFGEVLLLEIGATCVGSIVQSFQSGAEVEKGDEKGLFRFGGSSTITIFEPGRIRFADDLVQQSTQGREVYGRMGELAGVIPS